MGFMTGLGPCYVCGRVFTFSVERVPSMRVDGEREPVCQPCMVRVNRERKARGLPPHPVMAGAYGPDEVP